MRCGTTVKVAAKANISIAIGASFSIRASSHRPGSVSKIASAKKRVDSAKLVAATSAPRVNTVQYTRNRLNLGRAVGTRQIRLKMASTLERVTSSDTTSTNAPVVVSDLVFDEKSARYPCTALAAVGMKLAKMYFFRLRLHRSKTGNADSTPNTTIDNGTSANTLV